jgi:hypothetical protein
VVGEADGTVKYAVDDDADPRRAQAALVAEKRREDLLRATGLDVVRWGARDLQRADWAEQLAARLYERRGLHFRGRVVVQEPRG